MSENKSVCAGVSESEGKVAEGQQEEQKQCLSFKSKLKLLPAYLRYGNIYKAIKQLKTGMLTESRRSCQNVRMNEFLLCGIGVG